MARIPDHGFTALRIEGGLLPPEFLTTVAGLQAGEQDNAAYGLTPSLNLRDEIGRAFRIAADLWADFRTKRELTGAAARKAAVEGWLVPFLQQALGFTLERITAPVAIGDRTYPITHTAFGGAVPMVLVPPSYRLDKPDAVFGDERQRRSPLGLVQELLNASDACLWGVVANGTELRLLRDNPNFTRPAWIEFDLERVFEDTVFADFAAFWLLVHASRLAPREGGQPGSCILERWRLAAAQKGERATRLLGKGVEEALRTLGSGFVRHKANNDLRARLAGGGLTADGLHQQLLRLVYRCLFMLVVEDRDLLHPPGTDEAARRLWREGYGIGQLRDRALRRHLHDSHGDLWQGLTVAFLALERGAPEIGAPALGGLFDRTLCPDLFGAALANADLLAAVRSLAFFRPERSKSLARVNYRDLGVEELGSVYEGLLELHPLVAREPSWDFGYLEEGVAGSERKRSGSYYTPDSLVQELLKSALEPVIRRTATDNPYDQRAALLGLRIIDPACGSGHFLLAAARRLGFEIARLDAAPDAPTEAQRRHALREVVRHCIHGVDRNPLAVELCKAALWIETVEPGKPLSFLDHQIRCGDSLIGVFDLKVLEDGIPDEAYQPKTGDDKQAARDLKTQNKVERTRPLLGLTVADRLDALSSGFNALDAMAEDETDAVAAKAAAYERLLAGEDAHRLNVAADLWTAAFFADLDRPEAGQPGRVPTTLDVWKALSDAGGHQGPRPATAMSLAHEHGFFHWPLAFPAVFAKGGFDVVLGNPPWERIKLQEQEFFAARDECIAKAPNKAAREKLVRALATSDSRANRRLHAEFRAALHAADAQSTFVRGSGRWPLTAVGDVNTYAIFAELFLCALNELGRAGLILPLGIATDDTTKAFFGALIAEHRLASLLSFENEEFIFRQVHHAYRFALLTLRGSGSSDPVFSFFCRKIEHLTDPRRRFTLSPDDIALINPNTKTCPIFRTAYDAELTAKIYRRVPVLIDESKGADGNPWGIRFMAMFHMANDSGLFRTHGWMARDGGTLIDMVWTLPDGTRWLPLYEAKMIHHYDHRWASYDAAGECDDVPVATKADPSFQVMPRYWVEERQVLARIADLPNPVCRAWANDDQDKLEQALVEWAWGRELQLIASAPSERLAELLPRHRIRGTPDWEEKQEERARAMARDHPIDDVLMEALLDPIVRLGTLMQMARDRSPTWLIGWRDICRSTDERTVISSAIPGAAVGHKFLLMRPDVDPTFKAALLANMSSLVFDYVARQKVGGTSLTYFTIRQIAALAPNAYSSADLEFIVPRVIELTYTASDMAGFAQDQAHDGEVYTWSPARRTLLRAELDAYYAWLYGLTRDELRYLLDPHDVRGSDWPSETFRVLKHNEIREHGLDDLGRWRTQALVLDAFDRFHADGTFDPTRTHDPHYLPQVARAYGEVKAKLAESELERGSLELLYRQLLQRVDKLRSPVLFVEGSTDVPVVEAAWDLFAGGEPRPFEVEAAGGTLQMRALATPGKAMRQILGGRLVMALSDNDGAGRDLWNDGHLHKGGAWRPQTNGVHWCLLPPSPEFKAVMTRLGVAPKHWPFTLENAFPAAVRRRAMADEFYAMSDDLFEDLSQDHDLAKRMPKLARDLPPDDDAWLYLMAPTPEAKDLFSAWITDPANRRPADFEAFRPVIERLRELIGRHTAQQAGDPRQASLI